MEALVWLFLISIGTIGFVLFLGLLELLFGDKIVKYFKEL